MRLVRDCETEFLPDGPASRLRGGFLAGGRRIRDEDSPQSEPT